MSPPSRYYSIYLLFHVIISISHPHSLLYSIQSGIWPYQTTGTTFPDVTNNVFSSLTFLWQFIAYHTFLYTSLLLWIFIIHVWSFSHVNICHFFFLDSSFPISTFLSNASKTSQNPPGNFLCCLSYVPITCCTWNDHFSY